MKSVFVDTNVLIYAQDQASPTRAAQAKDWISLLATRDELVVSPQVVSEFVAAAQRRFRSVSAGDIHRRARVLLAWCEAPLDAAVLRGAMEARERFATSWWDALIVASALAQGCRALVSEDFQDGMRFGGLTVVNPFLHPPQSLFS